MSVESGPAGRPPIGAALRPRILTKGPLPLSAIDEAPQSPACKGDNKGSMANDRAAGRAAARQVAELLLSNLGLDADDPGFRVALPPHVAAARSKVRPGVDGDDVADPIGQRMGVFRSTGDLVARAVEAVVAGFSTAHAFRHVTPATDPG